MALYRKRFLPFEGGETYIPPAALGFGAVTAFAQPAHLAKGHPVTSTDPNFVPEIASGRDSEMTELDSSASGHTNDTLMITYNGKTDLSGGVGRGVMSVFVDAAGQIIAHTSILPTSSYLYWEKT